MCKSHAESISRELCQTIVDYFQGISLRCSIHKLLQDMSFTGAISLSRCEMAPPSQLWISRGNDRANSRNSAKTEAR